MRPFGSTIIISAALGVLLLSGCNTPIPEPETSFKDLPTQTYPFAVVWESLMASVQNEGYVVDASMTERDGQESGSFSTLFKMAGKDPLTKVERAHRIRARVKRAGDKTYQVRVASGAFERETPDQPWDWVEDQPEMVATLRTNLERILRERYEEEDRQ